jgi:DNA-binding response OmpR family regulator
MNGSSPNSPPCVLIVQTDPFPEPLAVAMGGNGFEVAGPFSKIAETAAWMGTNTPDAAILDVALQDGASFDLARELQRKGVPFLFHTSWENIDQIPLDLREAPFVEKPAKAVLMLKLLSRMTARVTSRSVA